MDLADKLDKMAKSLSVWDHGYDQFTADVRELLEAAAKKIRRDEAWISHLQRYRTTSLPY